MRKISDNLKVIKKFVSINGKPHASFYGRESKLAKNLILKYGLDFLLWVPLPDNKQINTLLWLSCHEGYQYLNAYLMEFKSQTVDITPKTEQIKLEQEKVGEDIQIKPQPRTLLDFLNKYK